MKQFLNSSSQKRPILEKLEKFMKSFLPWEELGAEAEKESKKEKETAIKGYELISHASGTLR